MPHRLRNAVLASLLIASASLVACSGAPPEQPILNQFFKASSIGDKPSLDSFATTYFDPKTDGTVNSFSITTVGAEQRTPLSLKALGQAYVEANDKDQDYLKRKDNFSGDNIDALKRIMKAESENKPITGKDAEVHEAWTKLTDEGEKTHADAVDAKKKLMAEKDVVDHSAQQPGQKIDVTKYDGDLVTKDVTISASWKSASGESAKKTIVVTMKKAELKGGEKPIDGRWVITATKVQ